MSNFMTLCERGEASPEDIDCYVDVWHESNTGGSLHTFLGMTRSEYGFWVQNPNIIPFLIAIRKGITKKGGFPWLRDMK